MRILTLLLTALLSVGTQTPRQADSVRRAQMAELFAADDKEGYLKAGEELIAYHEAHGNDKYLFDAYATRFDRLEMWGRFDEALATLEEMSSKALERESAVGKAITAFCYGQFYLSNRNPAEAETYYRDAFTSLCALGENARALRAGFNLQAIAMNLNTPEKGLAINDTTAILLGKMEEKAGQIYAGGRLGQNRYRLVLMVRCNRLDEAAPLKDSLLHYFALSGEESSQFESVQTAILQYEQAIGDKHAAYARLDTLIQRNLRNRNYWKAARFRLGLAGYQRENGDLALAVDNFDRYSVEIDSAQIHRTNEQLNDLTKRYKLEELTLENKLARERISFLLVIMLLLVAITIASFSHSRAILRKNRALFRAAEEIIQEEEVSDHRLIEQTDENQDADTRLYTQMLYLIYNDEVFRDPELSRDRLSAHLGTNRTYLTNIIRKFTGKTYTDFINHCRLRWAADNIVNNPEESITTIGLNAGFSSRSTFYNNFTVEYGMSPTEFRAVSIQAQEERRQEEKKRKV